MKLKLICLDHLFILFAIALYMHLLVFPLLLTRFVHSKYFPNPKDNEMAQFISREYQHRKTAASNHFSEMNADESRMWYHNNNYGGKLKLLFLVLSVKRKEQDYLVQTISELDQQIKEYSAQHRRSEVGAVICNSDWNPADHQQSNFLKNFIPTIIEIEQKDRVHPCCTQNSCSREGRSKQKSDYFECVKSAKENFDFDWILVMEDDTLPLKSSVENIMFVLNQVLDDRKDDVFMAKFFYSLKFQGFEYKLFSIVELFSVSSLTSILLNWLHKKLFVWRSILCPERYSIVAWFILSVLFYVAVGRQHTLLALQSKLVPFRIETAHADANLAIVYPKTSVNLLLHILEKQSSCNGPEVDLELFKLAQATGQQLIWIQGQFFQHLGFKTSLEFKSGKLQFSEFIGQFLYLP